MNAIMLLTLGPMVLAILAVNIVRLVVRPKPLKRPDIYTGAQARIVMTLPDGSEHELRPITDADFNYNPGHASLKERREELRRDPPTA